MKKFLLLTLPLLVSCSSENLVFFTRTRNKYCMDVERFKVFQVLEDRSALAFQCIETDYSYCLVGSTVFLLTPQKDVDYYDDMYVTPLKNRCAVQSNVFRYETKKGDTKTVPVIAWGYKYEPKDEKELLDWSREYTDEVVDACKKNLVLSEMDTPENMKKCECMGIETTDASLKGKSISVSEIEQMCSNKK
ncbi:MAG: hypothetical protein IJ752_05590 [Alphaproteobacteria bacterium]|nr:hypothetical protein [Alphaproteobacteria bacterium]